MNSVTLTLPLHNAPLLRVAAQMLDDYAEAAEAKAMQPAASVTADAPPPAAAEAPPAAAEAPPAAADAPPPASTTGELDAAGRPWDARIHTSAKTKTKDGRWKYMRGVDKALVAQIESVGTLAPTPPADAGAGGLTYGDIQGRVDDATDAGMLHPQGVLMILQQVGVKNLPELTARPDLWPTVSERLDMILGPA